MSKGSTSGILLKERYQVRIEVISKSHDQLSNLKKASGGTIVF